MNSPPTLPSASEHLIAQGKLQAADLGRAQMIAEESNAALHPLLVRLGLVSEKDLAAVMVELHGLPHLEDSDIPEEPMEIPGLSPKFLRDAGIVPLGSADGHPVFATADPEDTYTLKALELATDKGLAWGPYWGVASRC